MQSQLINGLFLKAISLFSLVRLYNVVLMAFAQIICSIFFFSESKNIYSVVFDYNIWCIVIASSSSISAGYIINNFFDTEKDLINRPLKTILEKEISGKTKLRGYIILNLICLIFATQVSMKAFLFFLFYIISIFLYSVKISRHTFFGNILSVLLSITPFFAIVLYYKYFTIEFLLHALFLFFLILIKELLKDLKSLKGDITMNYKTIPVMYGEKTTKNYILLAIITIVTISCSIVLNFDISLMRFYYFLSIPYLIFFTYLLLKYNSIKKLNILYNSMRLLILMGLFSVILRGL